MPAQSVLLSATVVPVCHQAVWAIAARATAATGATFALGNELPRKKVAQRMLTEDLPNVNKKYTHTIKTMIC